MACLNPEDFSTIRLIHLSGTNPNASDNFIRNGPLHILAIMDRVGCLSGIDDDVIRPLRRGRTAGHPSFFYRSASILIGT